MRSTVITRELVDDAGAASVSAAAVSGGAGSRNRRSGCDVAAYDKHERHVPHASAPTVRAEHNVAIANACAKLRLPTPLGPDNNVAVGSPLGRACKPTQCARFHG